jgi:hypothetical protein
MLSIYLIIQISRGSPRYVQQTHTLSKYEDSFKELVSQIINYGEGVLYIQLY